MWDKAGTVAVTNGSTTIAGTGTNWVNESAGHWLWIRGEELPHEIVAITSGTLLTVSDPVEMATASGLDFRIIPTTGLTRDLGERIAELIALHATAKEAWDLVFQDFSTTAFALWQAQPGNEAGTVADFFDAITGPTGQSAYAGWIAEGNTGTFDDFIDHLSDLAVTATGANRQDALDARDQAQEARDTTLTYLSQAAGHVNAAELAALNAAANSSGQDMSGLSETLGPSAILGALPYGMSLDSDPNWVFRMGWSTFEREDRPTGPYLGSATNAAAVVAANPEIADFTGASFYATDTDTFLKLTNTAGTTTEATTRGPDKLFPVSRLITWEASRLIIWNALTGAMWKVHDFTGFTITSVKAANGQILVGTTTGVVVLNYAADDIDVALTYTTSTTPALVNNSVLALALTVLPDAPINPKNGLPYVTTFVGAEGGYTLLDGPAGVGTAVDRAFTGGVNVSQGHFRSDGALVFSTGVATYPGRYTHVQHQLPTVDETSPNDFQKGVSNELYTHFAQAQADIVLSDSAQTTVVSTGEGFVAADDQINFLYPNPSSPSDGAQIIMQPDNISPVMHGGTLFAGLASTDDTDLSGANVVGAATATGDGWTDNLDGTFTCDGSQSANSVLRVATPTDGGARYRVSFSIASYTAGSLIVSLEGTGSNELIGLNANGDYTFDAIADPVTNELIFTANADFAATLSALSIQRIDADRSPQANHLDVVGTVPRTKTDGELVWYSGQAASNHLKLSDRAELDYGTGGDFSWLIWADVTPDTFAGFIERTATTNWAEGARLVTTASNELQFQIFGVGIALTAGAIITAGVQQVGVVRKDGFLHLVYQGEIVASAANTSDMSVGGDVFFGGHWNAGNFVGGVNDVKFVTLGDGLTAEQLRLKYVIESRLINAAQVTYKGTVVRAVHEDKARKQFHILTDTHHTIVDGRTLVVLSEEAGDWTWIAVDDGMVAKG